ncbi:hypothetical protein JW865_06420 [Candidatus Bathyarchaeota archaeon]|nr:hypothetical protein [Candidatus Bathyarchaeota archaeon]
MNKSNVLVVYYSRTGTTKKVAEYISAKNNFDIEEIFDLKNRSGPIGWLMAGKDAGSRILTEIKPATKNPSDYDLVLIGTPIWNGTISTPIRTYINQNFDVLRKTAVFSTGDDKDPKALEDIKNILKEKPLNMIKLHKKTEVDTGSFTEKIDNFLKSLEI